MPSAAALALICSRVKWASRSSRAGQSGAGLIQLHHVSDICKLRKLELIGQPAELGVWGLLFEPGSFECRPDVDEKRHITQCSSIVQCLGG
jgi:hypothetical protein